MTTLTKSLIGAALTLPLVAFVAGVLASPESVQDDRSRPVIIGRVSEDDTEPQQDRHQPDGSDRDRDRAGPGGDATDDRASEGPAAPITPAPRYLDDDDDGGDDDGGDDDDGDTDDSSGGDD